ncbi:hypothetical protein MED121_05413 [Marinomonas sp. MED121]|nr:hypothetical protein MED121_05413 [Marinomonas sp. MED121]
MMRAIMYQNLRGMLTLIKGLLKRAFESHEEKVDS